MFGFVLRPPIKYKYNRLVANHLQKWHDIYPNLPNPILNAYHQFEVSSPKHLEQ
jgi:hypothetical protein